MQVFVFVSMQLSAKMRVPCWGIELKNSAFVRHCQSTLLKHKLQDEKQVTKLSGWLKKIWDICFLFLRSKAVLPVCNVQLPLLLWLTFDLRQSSFLSKTVR